MRSRGGGRVLQGLSRNAALPSKTGGGAGRVDVRVTSTTAVSGNSKPSNILGMTTSGVDPPLRTG
jgi:hypothetical protein